jgi:hypothetical protein
MEQVAEEESTTHRLVAQEQEALEAAEQVDVVLNKAETQQHLGLQAEEAVVLEMVELVKDAVAMAPTVF